MPSKVKATLSKVLDKVRSEKNREEALDRNKAEKEKTKAVVEQQRTFLSVLDLIWPNVDLKKPSLDNETYSLQVRYRVALTSEHMLILDQTGGFIGLHDSTLREPSMSISKGNKNEPANGCLTIRLKKDYCFNPSKAVSRAQTANTYTERVRTLHLAFPEVPEHQILTEVKSVFKTEALRLYALEISDTEIVIYTTEKYIRYLEEDVIPLLPSPLGALAKLGKEGISP